MKILSVFSGPRIDGNTHTLLKKFLKGVLSSNPSTEISEIIVSKKNIGYCNGCGHCRTVSDTCIKKDDMIDIYDKIKKSDIIVLAAPVYYFNMPAQLKIFIDRFYALKRSDFLSKKIVLITTFEGDDIKDSGAYNMINSIKDTCDLLSMDYCKEICVSTGTIPIKENFAALDKAFKCGAGFLKK